jgi:hypothetical protein
VLRGIDEPVAGGRQWGHVLLSGFAHHHARRGDRQGHGERSRYLFSAPAVGGSSKRREDVLVVVSYRMRNRHKRKWLRRFVSVSRWYRGDNGAVGSRHGQALLKASPRLTDRKESKRLAPGARRRPPSLALCLAPHAAPLAVAALGDLPTASTGQGKQDTAAEAVQSPRSGPLPPGHPAPAAPAR